VFLQPSMSIERGWVPREKHALTLGVVVKVAGRRAGPLDVGGD
jgi:hypothetical protein